jgi:hypothetical protein
MAVPANMTTLDFSGTFVLVSNSFILKSTDKQILTQHTHNSLSLKEQVTEQQRWDGPYTEIPRCQLAHSQDHRDCYAHYTCQTLQGRE